MSEVLTNSDLWNMVRGAQGSLLTESVWLQVLKNGILLDSRSASTMFPFVSTSLFHPSGILEGITSQGDPVVLDVWRPEMANANRLILGPPGWGKSYQVKATIIRHALKYAYRAKLALANCLKTWSIIRPRRPYTPTVVDRLL